ncbi:MAG: hypothetical protein ACLRZH_05740 [Ruthenibacterium lactatiformans]
MELHGVTDGLEVLVADRRPGRQPGDGLPYQYSVGRRLTAELIGVRAWPQPSSA